LFGWLVAQNLDSWSFGFEEIAAIAIVSNVLIDSLAASFIRQIGISLLVCLLP